MKKSLKVIASAAIAMSAFASVAMADDAATTTSTSATATAATPTSKDFKDLAGKDAALLAKIDALLAGKVFEGVSADNFGIDQNMTRAQVAKVLTLIYNIKVDTTVKTSSFTDVKADDAANGWAIPYIEAAKTAGLIDGVTDTTFAPGDNVTLGQFAKLLVAGLGKKVDVTGTPWYADAVKQAVALNLLPAGVDGSKFATRADLVGGAYAGQQAFVDANKPAKASVTDAKAIGVQKVQVTLNRDVDTSKATLTLTKGTVTVNTTAKFSDDKKSATLTLTDTKISAGDYTVTLGGLDASAIDTAAAKFTAQDEQVQKIDFISASDTIAYTATATVKLKASNQYGEAASFGAANYSAFVLGQTTPVTTDTDGNLVVTVNLKSNVYGTLVPGSSIIPVTVYANSNRITASKSFKLGTQPFLSKVDLGNVKYSNGGTALSAGGDSATIPMKLYDQYGNPVVQAQVGTGTTAEIQQSTINAIIAPYDQNLSFDSTKLFDSNGNAQIVINLANKEDKSSDYTVTVYGGSASATAKVSVSAASLATKIGFGTFTGTVAAGDTDVYLPITATDANGNALDAQGIADNASRFTFSATNLATNTTPTIVQYGSNKGKLHLVLDPNAKANSSIYVTAVIATANANSYAQTSIPIQAARVPDHISVTTEPAAEAILGASSGFTYQVVDQYGSNLGNIASSIADATGQTASYRVLVNVANDANSGVSVSQTVNNVVYQVNDGQVFNNAQLGTFNGGFNFNTTAGQSGSLTFKAVIQKSADGVVWNNVSNTVSRTLKAVASNTALTYSLGTVDTLYAAESNKSLFTDPTVTNNIYANSTFLPARKLSVTAKDSAGNTVALPNNSIQGISTSNASVVDATYTTGTDAFVAGNNAGTATVTAVVYTNVGTTITLTQNVTVKSDPISISSITTGNTSATYTNQTNVFALFNHLDVVDQYNTKYEDAAIVTYDSVLGVRYTVSGIKGTGNVTVNAKTGALAVDPGVNEFVITATTPNGKSVQVLVSR